MPTLTSSPASHTGYSGTVTFAIPAGTWTSGSWAMGHGTGNTGLTYPDAGVESRPTQSFAVAGVIRTVSWNQTGTITGAAMADIQAAAGGTLTMDVEGDFGVNWTWDYFTLTINGTPSGGSGAGDQVLCSAGKLTVQPVIQGRVMR